MYHDHLGSAKAVSGGVFKYYPFGYAYQEVSNPPTDNLYIGQKQDQSTGLWDASGHALWEYDVRGRVTEERRYIDGKVYTTQWAYDAMDRVLTMTYPDGEVVSYSYNNQLLLDSMSGSVVGSIASEISYNALDLPKDIKLPNAVSGLYLRHRYYGSNLDYGTIPYDALWDIRLEKTGANSLRLEHGHDSARKLTRTIETPSYADFTYEYDDLDRLLRRKITGGADQETFGYSAIGNITSKNAKLTRTMLKPLPSWTKIRGNWDRRLREPA